MPDRDRGRYLVLAICLALLIVSAWTILFYVASVGTDKIGIQLARFLFTLLLCVGLYLRRNWARLTLMVLSAAGAVLGALAAGEPWVEGLDGAPALFAMAGVYFVVAMLLLSSDVRAYTRPQAAPQADPGSLTRGAALAAVPPDAWLVRTTLREVTAPDLTTVQTWCREGKIPASALLHRPGSPVAVRADRLPETRSFFVSKAWSERFLPAVLTIEEARSVAMQGMIAALIVSGVTTLMILFASGALGIDAWGFVDVVLMLIFAFGIRRLWRWAAVAALLLFALGRLLMVADHPESLSPGSILVTLALVNMFVNGVRGTFAYRKLLREQEAWGHRAASSA
jgi:hypothetical protein